MLHAARAVAAAGRRVATITAAGPEPEAERARRGARARSARAGSRRRPASIRFAIRRGGRRPARWCSRRRARRSPSSRPTCRHRSRAVLLAPDRRRAVGGRGARAAMRCRSAWPPSRAGCGTSSRARRRRPLPLAALGARRCPSARRSSTPWSPATRTSPRWRPTPAGQLTALRAHFGPRPVLVVTAGADGAGWTTRRSGIRHLPVARRARRGLDHRRRRCLCRAAGGRARRRARPARTPPLPAMDGAAAYLAARR